MALSEEKELFKKLKEKYGETFQELLNYLRELDNQHVEGPRRPEMIKKRFPNVAEEDITFLLFCGVW
ncbi:MAG: hypothetical protein QXO67_02790 [Candidatus Bathyarchaeia archaeon]